jgi:ferredoxin-NADP reductase
MSFSSLSELQTLPSWSSRKTEVICTQVINETHNVKTFQFETKEPQLFHFSPGQFVGIQLEIDGERHNRSYTIASSPSRPHSLELTIKKEDGGAVSPWLHQNIIVGSSLEIRGPAGRFNCFDISSDKALLISAGSGVTPMMSMARYWSDLEQNKDVHFLNWVRSVDDIIFRREFALIDHRNESFKFEVICTQPGLGQNWLGRRGRINATTLQDMVPDLLSREVYCCGPEGFMQQVKKCLEQLEFDMEHYHDESFDPGGKKKAKLEQQKLELAESKEIEPMTSEIFTVTLTKANRTFDIAANEYLLERLESEGVAMDSSCRAGNCGACIVKKLDGITTTENETGLSEEDKKEQSILTCTTKVQSNISLDL